jgi:hypothetical protein
MFVLWVTRSGDASGEKKADGSNRDDPVSTRANDSIYNKHRIEGFYVYDPPEMLAYVTCQVKDASDLNSLC